MIEKERHIGVLRVSKELLLQCLNLPANTRIDDVRVVFTDPDVIELRVQHPGLARVDLGAVIPPVTAEFVSEQIEGANMQARFVRWRY